MNHWGASNRALSTFTHSHLPSCGWPVPAASVSRLHYLQNAPYTRTPFLRQSASPPVRKPDILKVPKLRLASLSEAAGARLTSQRGSFGKIFSNADALLI